MAPTNLLSLNHDVLSIVLALVSRRDAIHFSLVCRPAYHLALPRILGDVTLGGAFYKPVGSAMAQLTTFCLSMLGRPDRLQCLHTLQVMRDAFRRRIAGSWAVDAQCVRLLTDLLANSPNLQKATVWGLDILVSACPVIVDALSSRPLLSTICLGGEVPSLPTLHRTFPNARSVKFVDGDACLGTDWDAVDTSRSQDSAWAHLDHFDSGHPVLPLPCAVRRVDLRNPLPADEGAIDSALRYIERTRPVVLSCSVDFSVADEKFVARIQEVAHNLKYLQIILHGSESLAKVAAWMMRIGPLLANIPLLGLSLCSSIPTSFPSPSSSPAVSPLSSPRLAPTELPEVDPSPSDSPHPVPIERPAPPTLSMIARTLATAIPTVRYVGLQPHGPTTAARNVYVPEWFVALDQYVSLSGHSGGRKVQHLGADEGRRVGQILKGLDIYD